jgi:hypothetical protein
MSRHAQPSCGEADGHRRATYFLHAWYSFLVFQNDYPWGPPFDHQSSSSSLNPSRSTEMQEQFTNFAGLMTVLTLGPMSLGLVDLEVLIKSGHFVS